MSDRHQAAEEALLGAVLLRPTQLPTVGWLAPSDFAKPAHGHLWNVLQQLGPDRITPSAVGELLEDAEPGLRAHLSPARLQAMTQRCPQPSTAPLYGGMVLEGSVHRAVERAGSRLQHRTTTVDQLDTVTAAVDEGRDVEKGLEQLAARWQRAPETVRSLLDGQHEPTPVPTRDRAYGDTAAERATVASLLRWPSQDVQWLSPEDFTDPEMGSAFRAVQTLVDRGAPVDPLTVAWESQRRQDPQPAVEELQQLDAEGVPAEAEYVGYEVLGRSALDQMDASGARLQHFGQDAALPPAALVHRSERELSELAHDRQRLHQADGDLEPSAVEAGLTQAAASADRVQQLVADRTEARAVETAPAPAIENEPTYAQELS